MVKKVLEFEPENLVRVSTWVVFRPMVLENQLISVNFSFICKIGMLLLFSLYCQINLTVPSELHCYI